jgi:EF-hand domain pair
MLERRRMVLAIPVLFAAGATAASGNQKSTGSPQGATSSKPNSVEAGEEYAKKLLLLMDTDKSGKVSKKEFMAFMEKEFDRLDTNHDGELDVKELAKIHVRPYVGK